MATRTFHRFPDLPKEIRDEIWRLCLPHRVVELDWPDFEWYFSNGYPTWLLPLDDTRDKPQTWPCRLTPTSRINCAPPIISRLCHESRTLALKTGHLQTQTGTERWVSFRLKTERFWVDRDRDVLHLHWHPFLYGPVAWNPLDPVEHLMSMSHSTAAVSICADLLDAIEQPKRQAIMRLLEHRPRWSICGALVVIHVTDEAAAVESGLWGTLGEERVVLVDGADVERLHRFRRLWLEHGTEQDRETKVFFEAAVDGVPKLHYLETPEEFLLDLETRWLLDSFPTASGHSFAVEQLRNEVWLTKPEDFDGRDDDPRAIDYGDLPGRPFARQLWSPNRDHPWVKDVLSRMPEFVPTIMFRLCTNNCHLSA